MADDVHSFNIFYDVGGQPAMNALHFACELEASTTPQVDSQELIAAFRDDAEDLWKACIPEGVTILGYKARRINNGGGPTVVLPRGIPGGRTGDFSASSIGPCLIWSYFSGVKWRTGRTFLPAISEDDISLNLIDAGLLTPIDALIAFLIGFTVFSTSHAISWEFGVYQPTTETFSDAAAGVCSGRPGTQRRRMLPSF